MTKYLIGVAVLLVAGWTAYRAFSNLHAKDEPSENLNQEIMAAAHKLRETVDPHPIVEVSSNEDAAAGPGVLPLFVGATWTYIVTDSRDTEGPRTFSLKIDRAPEAAVPGMSEAGFEGAMKSYPLTDTDGAARIDGLGFFSAPGLGDAEEIHDGETLPERARFIDGAVWELRSERDVTYQIADKSGLAKTHTGHAKERHRALARKLESVTVPAGRFDARRVDWISRIEIRTDDRPVLMPLTTEPYRRETMWVMPGIGIVKREISFLEGEGKGTVIFELVSGPN